MRSIRRSVNDDLLPILLASQLAYMLSALRYGISFISRQQCKSASCIWCPCCSSQCCEYSSRSIDDLIHMTTAGRTTFWKCIICCYCISSSIVLLRQMFTWYFQRKLNKNGDKLAQLKEKKNKILEQVMDKETYKASKGHVCVLLIY